MENLEWEQMWGEGKLADLAEAVRSAEPTPERARARAQLAAVGALTLVEGVEATQRLRESSDDEADLALCRVLRAGAEAGAASWASATLENVIANPELDEVALLREQIEAGIPLGGDRAHWDILRRVEGGDPAALATELEAVIEAGPAWLRPRDFAQLASLWQAALRHDAAARIWQQCLARWPAADGVGAVAAEHALCQIASGQGAAAIESLIALRDNEGADAEARGLARRLVARLELEDPGETQDWVRVSRLVPLGAPRTRSGARALELAMAGGDALPRQIGEIDSLAALRFELERNGLVVWRAALTTESIASCLAAGATVVLGEERPLGAGFAVVLGVEKNWGVLEIAGDERAGVILRSVDEQWDRCAFHGRSAVIVLGDAETANAVGDALARDGISHDERFDLIDACDLDDMGNKPHGARVEGLTELAVERSPEVPKCWQRRGAALLALFERGELEDGQIQRWYAGARARFAEAEWAYQIFAPVLEAGERYDEAGIAWSDAARIDEHDYRNYLGMARVRAATGLTGAAHQSIDRALVLEPASSEAWSLSSRLALSRGDQGAARLAAELATSLAPEDPNTHDVLALVHEANGDRAEAIACVRRSQELRPGSVGPLSRLARHLTHSAEWTEARAAGERLIEIAPGHPLSWAITSEVAFATGAVEEALAIARKGVEVSGPYEAVVAALSKAFVALSTDPDAAAGLVPLLAPSDDAPYDFAGALLGESAFDAALSIYDALGAGTPSNINPRWRRARALVAQAQAGADLDAACMPLLLDICERAGSFPYPRVLASWLLLDEGDSPRALELLAGADAERDPAVVWSALRHVLLAEKRDDDAAEIDARLRSLGESALLGAARSLADFGRTPDAVRIVEASEWLDESFARAISLAVAHNEARDYVAVTEAAKRALELDPEGNTGRFAATAAFRAGDWQAASDWLKPICAELSRESGNYYTDPWGHRAMLAVARSLSGDETALSDVIPSAERHPDVVRAIARGGVHSGREDLKSGLSTLSKLAPAWHRSLTRVEVAS